MLDVIFGISSAATFGANSAIARRGVLRASADYIAIVTTFSGPVFFSIVTLISGDLLRLGQFPWQAYVYFAISGLIHFVFGRIFAFRALQLIGATRAVVVMSLGQMVSIVQAIVVLHEVLTPTITLGIIFSLCGPTLIALKEQSLGGGVPPEISPSASQVDRQTLYLGLLYSGGTALLWGSSPIFVKLGLQSGGSAMVGTLTAYVAASLAMTPTLLSKSRRTELFQPDWKTLQLALASGLTINIAQMLRYIAFANGPVIIVSLMLASQPIWNMLYALVFNRKLESFSRWVILANCLVLIGTVLVIRQ